jgi:heme-degrading monooxygenase HmoA
MNSYVIRIVTPAPDRTQGVSIVAVVFINCFEVPAGREDAFLALWQQIDSYMQGHPGFRWRRLYRSLDASSHFSFVNLAEWDSAGQFEAAHDDEFRRMQSQPGWLEFPARPALYALDCEQVASSAVA